MNRINTLLVVLVAGGAFGQAHAPIEPYWEAASSAMDKDFVRRNADGLTDSDARFLANYTNFAEPLPSPLPPEQKLTNVMAKVRMATVISASETTAEGLAGHYANPGPSINNSTFGGYALFGRDLYLFPDSTYIYLEWADIMPSTIYGKGTWAVSNSVVHLCDDRAIQASGYGADPSYLALALTNTVLQKVLTNVVPRRVVLLAAGFLRQPLENGSRHGDREMDLLVSGLERAKCLRKNETEATRRKLMAECWRPGYFAEHANDRLTNAAAAAVGMREGLLSEDQLRADGYFLFPQARAQVLCDMKDLRVSAWSSDELLYVQAVVWADGSSAPGARPNGQACGDSSSLALDLDANREVTANVDRDYCLNARLAAVGLSYSVMLGRHSSTTNRSDSCGDGAVCYVNVQDGRRVRVDSYVLPLRELGRKPGDAIRLCYSAWSGTPFISLNSAGDTNRASGDGCYHISQKLYADVALRQGDGPTLQDIASSWAKDTPGFSRSKPVLDSNEDWFSWSTVNLGFGARRTQLPGNSEEAIRAELAANDFLTRAAAKAGLTPAEIERITLQRERGYDWFTLKQNGARPEIFEALDSTVQNYVRGRHRGYSPDFLLSSFRRAAAQDKPEDPDLRLLLKAHPELPAGAVRRLSEGFGAADGGGSNRWVRYVVADKEIATVYTLCVRPDGKVTDWILEESVDPKEIDPKFEAVFKEVGREVEAKMKADGTAGHFGSCHTFWRRQKEALKQRGIEWRSPPELNPNTNYD